MHLLKRARKSQDNGPFELKESTNNKINLITMNKPEEDFLKESIVNMKIIKNNPDNMIRAMVFTFEC